MKGQWIGRSTGTNPGLVILDVDDLGDHFKAHGFLYEDDLTTPSTFVDIDTPGKVSRFDLEVPVFPIDDLTGNPTTWNQLAHRFPGQAFPSRAKIQVEWNATRVIIKWKSDIGTEGTIDFPKTEADQPSEYEPLPIKTWDEFKTFIRTLEQYRYIYRGQENSEWRLRTCFHRTGRANLHRFMTEDIPTLHQRLSALTRHAFNLGNPMENGAFYCLVQHHGYPTPLLDWTYSPFIGAYFAYRALKEDQIGEGRKVRVFVFDKMAWCAKFRQLQRLSPARLHFSMLEALSIDNPRMVPQQALSTVTNVDDVESYVRTREKESKSSFLRVIDLPSRDRGAVLRELSLMGITAGSLFPGLDGACEELKGRFFQA